MANYVRSFNFTNGVAVDNESLLVNAAGLVGIGTTKPEKLLDVHGNARVTGFLTAANASVTGIVTVGNITIDGSTGIISATSFTGSAGQSFGGDDIVAISTVGFIASGDFLSTTRGVGIGTMSPVYKLQVGRNPATHTGVGISEGSIVISKDVFVRTGVTTTPTLVVTGMTTSKDLEVTGVSTLTGNVSFGSSAFFGDSDKILLGDGNDLEIYHDGSNSYIKEVGIGTLYIDTNGDSIDLRKEESENLARFIVDGAVELYYDNDKKLETTDYGINVTGVVTATSFTGDLTGTATTATNLSDGANITTGTIDAARLPSAISADITGDVDGNVTGTASSLGTARNISVSGDMEGSASFDGSADVSIASTLSSSFSAQTTGVVTAATIVGTAASFGLIGINTSSPSVDLQIIKESGNAELEVISETAKSSISIGNSVGAGTSSAFIVFGGASGFNPDYSTAQSFDIVNRDVGNINFYLDADSNSTADKGFYWHRGSNDALLMTLTRAGNLGIGITNPPEKLNVQGISSFTGNAVFDSNVTISGTLTITSITANVTGNVTGDVTGDLSGNVNTTVGFSTFNDVEANKVGIQSSNPRSVLDLSQANAVSSGFILLPQHTTTGRNSISPTIAGAVIYNITENRIEFYDGSNWRQLDDSAV